MKKFIALAVAVVMLAALAVPAFAELSSDGGGTEVIYTKKQSYVLMVPAEVYINGSAGNIDVLEYSISGSRQLRVTLDTNNGTMTNTATGTNVQNAFAVEINGSTQMTYANFTGASQSATIKAVSTSNTPTGAGQYEGGITYTIEIVDR